MTPQERIAGVAERLRAGGLPDFLNLWLALTPETLAENESRRSRPIHHDRNRRIPTMTLSAAIGPKEQALRDARAPKAKPARKVHAADKANLDAISVCKRFVVSLFHDGEHEKHEGFSTLPEARAKGAEMEKANKSSRLSIVYAVTEDGRSFPVPRDYQAPTTQTETDMPKTAAKANPAKATTKTASERRKAKPARERASPKTTTNARYDWKGATEGAAAGRMPPKLDFSADTHTRYRPALAEVEKLAKDKDLSGLKKFKWDGFVGSSVTAILRYRDLCMQALDAKA